MVGKSDSPQDLGVMPCAISWLFRLIYEQRQKTGARFSVRVSALELSGRSETLRDLLSEYAAGKSVQKMNKVAGFVQMSRNTFS